jgi:hypothetical protein
MEIGVIKNFSLMTLYQTLEDQILIYKMEYQILAHKKRQLVLQIPIGTSNTNWYFKYQLVLQIPIGTSNTNWYFKYQLVLQYQLVLRKYHWYFEYQEYCARSNDPTTRRTTTTTTTTRTTKWI